MTKTSSRTVQAGMFYRTATLEKTPDERSFAISFSSEEPVERIIDGELGLEILSHEPDNINFAWVGSGRAPLLLDHDPGKQIGVIEKAELGTDRKGRAIIRFGKSELAEQIYIDVVDGIRTNISVGYEIHRITHEQQEGGPDIFRVTNWLPLEISVVSIPADQNVGIGRTTGSSKYPLIINRNYQGNQPMENNAPEQTAPVQPSQTAPSNPPVDVNTIRDKELSRIRDIDEMGKRHNMGEDAARYIKEGKTANQFGRFVADSLYQKSQKSTIKAYSEDTDIGLNNKEARQFSFMRAIRAAATGDWSQAGFEKEVSDSTAKKLKREPSSFFIPIDVLRASSQLPYRRDLQKAVQTAGGYLVPTDYLADSFIELLRNKMMVQKLGARVLTGLEGDVQIPKLAGGATAYWVSEGEEPDESTQQFAQVNLTPKTVGAFTDLTRKLIMQASPDVEALVREDLATVIALEIDRVAINGSGVGPEPEGILNTTGVGSVTISTPPTWANIVDLESEVATDNADVGALAYLCNASMRGSMKKKPKETGQATYIWEDSSEPGMGTVNGYRAGASNQVPANKIIFGNFNDQIIGEWGILDVMVDPYALSKSGGLRIRLLQDVDTAIRHAQSFAVGSP